MSDMLLLIVWEPMYTLESCDLQALNDQDHADDGTAPPVPLARTSLLCMPAHHETAQDPASLMDTQLAQEISRDSAHTQIFDLAECRGRPASAAAAGATQRPSKMLARPRTALPPVSIPEIQFEATIPATARRSPKPTLLRDQHLPGQLLHQKTSFPSDLFMRHDAACATPSPLQPATFTNSNDTLRLASGDSSATQPEAALRRSPKPTLLRDQHVPGELLHHQSSFPSNVYMRHEAACALASPLPHHSALCSDDAKLSLQQPGLGLQQQTDSAAPSMAMSQTVKPLGLSDTALASAPKDAVDMPSGVPLLSAHDFSHSPRQGGSRLQQSRKKSPRTPRSLAETWFEGTTHDLARNKSWATEWLAMGAQDEDVASPDLAQRLLQSAQQVPTQQQAVQQTSQQQATQQALQQSVRHPLQQLELPMQPAITAAQLTHQKAVQQPQQLIGSAIAAQSYHSLLELSAVPEDGMIRMNTSLTPNRTSGSDQRQLGVHSRPWTAPNRLLKAAAMPWVLDVTRLHSARPGSGGSPTAR